jgi:hypothetical protein
MLVPYKRFTIETAVTVDKAIHAFSQVVQSSRPFWPNPFSDDRRHFVGSVSEKGFRVVRNVYYLNSFLPQIKGVFEPSAGGTDVKITMIGNPFVIASFVAVFAFFAFFFTVFLPIGAVSKLWVVLGLLAGGVLGYLIYTSAFIVNMAIDRKYLLALFSNRE